MNESEFSDFVDQFGGQSQFAKSVSEAINLIWAEESLPDHLKPSIKQDNVWVWLNRRTRPVPPAEYVRAIVRAARVAGIDVDEHKLRPDVYGKPALDAAA